MKKYVICMYIRLSSEDTDLKDRTYKDESGSITAQRRLISDYIASREEFAGCKVIERCDDGFSGTHFDNRPAFVEMIDLAKRGEVNCIIVKDFSRFGRNYVELGDYLEQVFPFLGVRFISINDGYDSNDLKEGETGGLDVAFRNLIYDYYSRTTSKKIRLSYRQLAENGKFYGTHALYGYKKSDVDKHKLEIDPKPAKIVREMFDMRLAGMTVTDIAANLNERGIESPAALRIRKGETSSWCGLTRKLIWTQGGVDWILRNEEYTGTLVMQKQKNREIAGKTYRVPEEEWVKVEGTHEAIVSKEEYLKVQGMYRKRARQENKMRNIYSCGYCGRKMNGQRRNGRMICMAGRVSPDGKCKEVRMNNKKADAAVLLAIQQKLKLCMDEEEARRDEKGTDAVSITEQVVAVVGTLKAKEKAWMQMYDDYTDEKISREAFISFKAQYDKDVGELEGRLAKLREKQEVQALRKDAGTAEKYSEVLEATKLTDEIIDAFVDSVDVYEDERLEIHLKIDEDI